MRTGLLLGALATWFLCENAVAQETAAPDVEVSASAEEFEELGGYGQPQWAERSRASTTTKLYVLSPHEVFAGILSESGFLRSGKSTHDLMQDIELGLPHRFEIGFENHIGISDGDASNTIANIEARYAFGAWENIPLNPAIAVEYKFGIGEKTGTDRDQPDAYELQLLLGQEFIPRIQWAANVFFEQELGARRNRQAGFTQDVVYVIVPDKFTLGTEMRYTHDTASYQHRGSDDEFIIGPSVAWKPNRHTVVSLAPLFGCTHDSPPVALFVTVSLEFGGGESKTAPGSRN